MCDAVAKQRREATLNGLGKLTSIKPAQKHNKVRT